MTLRPYLLSLLLLALPACAGGAFRHELLLGYLGSNPDSHATRRVVLGVDLGPSAGWRLVSLGYSDLRVLRPATDRDSSAPSCHGFFMRPVALCRTDTEGTTRALGLIWRRVPQDRDVGFGHFRALGAHVRLSPHLPGLGIGAVDATALWAPADSSGRVRLHYESADLYTSQLTYLSEGTMP